MNTQKLTTALVAGLGWFCLSASAITVDESFLSDLSGNFSNPAAFTLDIGSNSLIGQIGNNGDTGATNGQDADYITFTVPAGTELTSINVDSYLLVGSTGGSFFGYVAGTSFGGQGGGDIDGNVIFNAGSGEILDNLGVAGTLAAGDYSFWLQETGNVTVDYSLNFSVSAVPEPSVYALLIGSLAFACVIIRRRS